MASSTVSIQFMFRELNDLHTSMSFEQHLGFRTGEQYKMVLYNRKLGNWIKNIKSIASSKYKNLHIFSCFGLYFFFA